MRRLSGVKPQTVFFYNLVHAIRVGAFVSQVIRKTRPYSANLLVV